MADGIPFRTLPLIERMASPARAAMASSAAGLAATSRAMPLAMAPQHLAELAGRRGNIDVRATLPEGLVRRFADPGTRPTLTPVPLPVGPPPPVLPTVVVAPPPPATMAADNPFQQLPQPNPGDRIRSDDFRVYSRCLAAVQNACMLSATLFGRTLAEARPLIAAQQLEIASVMSVFGTLLGAADPSLDQRRVVQVAPVAYGERRLQVVVSEAVETRRLTPNLMNLTYAEAMERIRAVAGDATLPRQSVRVGQLVGSSLGDATRAAVTSNA